MPNGPDIERLDEFLRDCMARGMTLQESLQEALAHGWTFTGPDYVDRDP
jgi:hypothetical protein